MGMPRGQLPLTEVEVREILRLKGLDSAQNVGRAYRRGTETVRRIWRRETYMEVAFAAAPTSVEERASEDRTLALLGMTREGLVAEAAAAVHPTRHDELHKVVLEADSPALAAARSYGVADEVLERLVVPKEGNT